MDLDDVRVRIRPRNHWESVDLGFRLAREQLAPLYVPWVVTLTTIAILVHLVCWGRFGWALLIMWWLKPFLDRVLLHVLSRAVFGRVPRPLETLSALPRILRQGWLPALTVLRWDTARSFNLALWQLEGLSGRTLRARRRVMEKKTRSPAAWLTFTCLQFELVVFVTLVGLLVLMTPEQPTLNWLGWWFGEGPPKWLEGLTNMLYVVAIGIIEPLYVAGGFGLYLNRRTVLEGWDIEIEFRRMAHRLSGPAGGRAA